MSNDLCFIQIQGLVTFRDEVDEQGIQESRRHAFDHDFGRGCDKHLLHLGYWHYGILSFYQVWNVG